MSRIAPVTIAVLAALFSASIAPAQPMVRVPNLPTATLSMSWSDLAQLLQTEQFQRQGPPPPFPWTLASIQMNATLEDADTFRVAATYVIEVWQEQNWVTAPLLGAGVAPVSVQLNGEPTSLMKQPDGTFALLIGKPGHYTAVVEFYVKGAQEEGKMRLVIPSVQSPVTQLDLRLPYPVSQVAAPQAMSVSVSPDEIGTLARLVFTPTDVIEMTWPLPGLLQTEAPPVPEIPARVSSETTVMATVTDRFVLCNAMVNYTMLSGRADRFQLHLPADVNLFSVEGPGITWTQEKKDDAIDILVTANRKVEGSQMINLRYERAVNEEGGTLEIPRLLLSGVDRETGFIAVTAQGGVMVDTSQASPELMRIDASELPPHLRAMSASPVLLSFRYTDGKNALELALQKLKDVSVRAAGIDRADIMTVVTGDGLAVTRATYYITNHVKQFLRVTLPENATVWGAEVNGAPVKPATDETPGSVLVSLIRSDAIAGNGTFPVSVVYEQDIPKLKRWNGQLAWTSPSTDIPCNETTWSLYLPEKYRTWRSEGDLDKRPERGFMGMSSLISRKEASVSMDQSMARPMREGIERFFITDINNPAAGAMGMGGGGSMGRYDAPQMAPMASQMNSATITGVLPIRFNLPVTGAPTVYRHVMAAEGRSLSMNVWICNAVLMQFLGTVGMVIPLLLVFLVMLAVARLLRRIPGGYVLMLLIAVVAIALVVNAFWFGMPFRWHAVALATAVVLAVLLALPTRRKAPSAQPVDKAPEPVVNAGEDQE